MRIPYLDEQTQQCEAVLAVLADAGCPGMIPPGEPAREAWVLLRPTLRALWVPHLKHAWIEKKVRNDPEHYPWRLFVHPEDQRRYLCVALSPFLMLAAYRGEHPVCINYVDWHIEVTTAMMRHGWYDPATGHQPPPGEELNALEFRERGRDVFNEFFPGMGDAMTGHRPQTEEGRRAIMYRVVDEEGNVTWVRGTDMPNEDESAEEQDAW